MRIDFNNVERYIALDLVEMNFFKDFEGSSGLDARMYLLCPNCNGVFLHEYNSRQRVARNPIVTSVACPHCSHIGYDSCFKKALTGKKWINDKVIHPIESTIFVYDPSNYGSGPSIARLAAIVSKEGPVQQILELLQKYRLGIPRKVLLQVIARRHNREKLINQAIYLGLISQTKRVESESDNGSLYRLTERGSKVLIARKKL